MSFHQLLSPHCAMLNVALPPFYSSGRLIGQKRETWRRVGIKALVAPCRAIHHRMTAHWSGGMVVKPTHCLLMRVSLLLSFLLFPLLLLQEWASSSPVFPFLFSLCLPGWLDEGGCSTWHTKTLLQWVNSALSEVHAGQRSDLLINVGRGW